MLKGELTTRGITLEVHLCHPHVPPTTRPRFQLPTAVHDAVAAWQILCLLFFKFEMPGLALCTPLAASRLATCGHLCALAKSTKPLSQRTAFGLWLPRRPSLGGLSTTIPLAHGCATIGHSSSASAALPLSLNSCPFLVVSL